MAVQLAPAHPTVTSRGPLSDWLLAGAEGRRARSMPVPRRGTGIADDLQLALYLCYETHYSDVAGADLDEWDPLVLEFRRRLEAEFVDGLRGLLAVQPGRSTDVRRMIPELLAADDGPSLSAYMEAAGTLDQMRQFVVHRSAYQLKEADPHTWAIPRLQGTAKRLLATIQAGEYGAEDPRHEVHALLFADTMRALGLDDTRHAYLDRLPASALMISNLISMFGLHRRLRGALVGHLAVFEMTSVVPMGRYSRALDRIGAPAEARRFYDVHVLADAEHELMALEMAGALADAEPDTVPDIAFGARCAIAVEHVFAADLLSAWGVA
jgi:hypothetical protein